MMSQRCRVEMGEGKYEEGEFLGLLEAGEGIVAVVRLPSSLGLLRTVNRLCVTPLFE